MISIDSYHADTGMRRVLLQIPVESHRFLYDFLVQLRGIQQVQAVALPDGKAQVGNIQSFLITRDGDDVTVMDGLTQQLAVDDTGLRNVAAHQC